MDRQLEVGRYQLSDPSKNVRLSALKQLITVIRPEDADLVGDTLGRTLCDLLAVEANDSCLELTVHVLQFIVYNLKDTESVKIISELVVKALVSREVRPGEYVRISLSTLTQTVSESTWIPFSLIRDMLADECCEVVSSALSIISTCSCDLDLIDQVLPLLKHKTSKVRLTAMGVIDRCFIRSEPWKKTFSVISKLAALESNEIPVSDFFQPSLRFNYMSALTFDDNIKVRREWFRLLVSWTATLEDRSDIDMHLCPYILTGLFDPDTVLRSQVTSWVETDIAPGYKCEDEPNGVCAWVQKCARRFIHAFMRKLDVDFKNCSESNVLLMLNTIVKYIGSDGVVEWVPNILSVYARVCDREPNLCSELLETLGRSIKPETWYDVIPVAHTDTVYWKIVDSLLVHASDLPQHIIEYFAHYLVPSPNACSVFRKLCAVTGEVFLDLAWAGIVLEETESLISMVAGNTEILHEIAVKLVANQSVTTPTLVYHYLLIAKHGEIDPEDKRRVMNVIKHRQLVDKNILMQLSFVDPEGLDQLLVHLLTSGSSHLEQDICAFVLDLEPNGNSVSSQVIDAFLQTKVRSPALICCWHLSSQLTPLQVERILEIGRDSTDTRHILAVAFLVRSVVQLSMPLSVYNIINLLVPVVLDLVPATSQKTLSPSDLLCEIESKIVEDNLEIAISRIMSILFQKYPQQIIGTYLAFEREGYIARSVYLSKFIQLT